jgi:hypothetical protein
MPNIQAILRQQLIEQTARLVARGGPGAFTAPAMLGHQPEKEQP